MSKQVPVDRAAQADEQIEHGVHRIAHDLAYQRLAIVNCLFYGPPDAGDRGWVLIDAGIPASAPLIQNAAAALFGQGARPAAIVLTHGHFDHVGELGELSAHWQAPIYAHPDEHPFLNGQSAYPPPDPTVGGGLMSTLAPLYPRGPIDVSPLLHALPADGSVPHMPGWQWIATPGHSPGHISLWRPADRTLIAGDAVITTRQESAFAVARQSPELHGPPMYYTPDWDSARTSAQRLAALAPELLISGHGPAMQGPAMRTALETLARDFDQIAVPKQGRYVGGS
ncbi:MAG TPA: MBL fold metallo-hydrolase [Roseiflexaceae bacterium]|nr:MBL fold metallo-hydrolase [Roseiflexaceae bacterium]